MEKGLTVEQFESRYAEKSGISVDELRHLGCHPAPCDCGEENCGGWQMKSQ